MNTKCLKIATFLKWRIRLFVRITELLNFLNCASEILMFKIDRTFLTSLKHRLLKENVYSYLTISYNNSYNNMIRENICKKKISCVYLSNLSKWRNELSKWKKSLNPVKLHLLFNFWFFRAKVFQQNCKSYF